MFRASLGVVFAAILWGIYRLRLYQLAREFSAQAGERARIARDLHDTLLQSFQASVIQMQTARNIFPRRPEEAIQTLDNAIGGAQQAIDEGRSTIQDLRRTLAPHSELEGLFTIAGQAQMALNRGLEPGASPRELTSGPSRLCQALGLTRLTHNGLDLTDPASALQVRDGGGPPADPLITVRIGINHARDWPLRFVLAGHACVSGPRSMR